MTYMPSGLLARRRQARTGAVCAGGNALSYRPDTMAGYTGYTPSSMCVPPAVSTRLSQRDPAAPLAVPRQVAKTADDGGATTYSATFKVDPLHDYSKDPRVRRPPAAAPAADPTAAAAARKFASKSTYQAELLQRDSSDINDGYRDSSYSRSSGNGGQRGGSASAPVSPAHHRCIPAVRPGYLTTTANSQLPIAEQFAALSFSSPQAAARSASADAHSCNTGSTLHAAAASAATSHLSPRPRLRKEDALMYSLDQHSRGRVPGYTGHRPQHNVALELPPPNSLTTWGAASLQALRRPLPVPDATHAINSKRGLLGSDFFGSGAGSEFVSENGLAEAARFHETSRPLEGRMRIPLPSRTAPHGAKFTA